MTVKCDHPRQTWQVKYARFGAGLAQHLRRTWVCGKCSAVVGIG